MVFRKSVEKIKILLKSGKNNGYFIWRRFHICDNISLIFFRRMRNKSCRENQNTHFIFSMVFRKFCPLWNSVEKYGRARKAADNMASARGILNK